MRSPRARSGFTLVELLMVIAIIALLAALLLAAVQLFLGKGPEVQTVNEIRQLEIAVQNFKNKFHVFPPSRIRLYPNQSDYNTADPNDAESLAYINKLWLRIGAFSGISWNGVDTNKHEIEGDQCLVFFLGGPQGTQGFSTNPTNPVSPAGDRVGPFHTFDASRLKDIRGDGFPSFVDYWAKGAPYVYFSSGSRRNGYHPQPSSGADDPINHTITGLGGRIYPYFEKPGQFLNPDTFQIISAGQDGKFGVPEGTNSWTDISGTNTYYSWRAVTADKDAPEPTTSNPNRYAYDNQSNFWTNKLGVP